MDLITMEKENFKLSHVEILNKQIADLYMSSKCSDIDLLIEDNKIPAHSSILGARSEYFDKLFSNDLNQTQQKEFIFCESLEAFKIILKYFYTGEIILSDILEIELLIQVVNLVEKYCLFYLKDNFENYFIQILLVENACRLLEVARLYELKKLEKTSFNLIERYPNQIIESECFSKISKDLLEELLMKKSFCASSELCIFHAVKKWSRQENRDIETVIYLVDLPIIPSGELFSIRDSGTLTDKKIFDAIGKQLSETKPNINVAKSRYNAQTISGLFSSELLNDNFIYDEEKGYTRHEIEPDCFGIVIELGRNFNINHIKMLLWDCDERSYSYFIEISRDQKKWKRIIDYSSYDCRSWQHLYFPATSMKYIKIVGTYCSKSDYFDVVTLEIYYEENIPEIKDGFLVAKDNVALIDMGATVLEAADWDEDINYLLNADPNSDYSANTGCKYGECILMTLNQPYHIGSIALLFENTRKRDSSKISIQISLNNNDWETVVNQLDAYGSRNIFFDSKPVLFIKIESDSEYTTYIKHFQCPSQFEE